VKDFWPPLLDRVGNAYLARRYALLFYSLIVSLAAVPLITALGYEARLVEIALAINLLAAAIAAHRGPVLTAILVLVLISLAGRLVDVYVGGDAYTMGMLGAWSLIAVLAAAHALHDALRAQTVSHEHVYAVLSAYLLGGVFFGVFYSVIEHFAPGSFVVSEPSDAGLPVPQGIYFSFVTLASLGYGDIAPVSGIARGLAVIEAIGGQLYLAALVARLVSMSR
jgi:hypothetical protein